MNSSRPYLLKAFYDWITDNHLTPYIVVEALEDESVMVPEEYIEDGRIILNISPNAIQNLDLAQNYVSFEAKFAGVPFNVYTPIECISAIYAKENGRGMVFKEEFDDEEDELPPDGSGGSSKPNAGVKKSKTRPNLTLVK